MVLTNTARGVIIDDLQDLFTTGGVGLGTASAQVTDSGLIGDGVTIDSCDSSTGWTHSGDAGAETENTTLGEYKEGTGCLNLPSTYSTGTATWYKTVSSVDLATTKIAAWFYIDNADDLTDDSAAITLDLGTGGFTNYNSYEFSKDDISSGWTSLVISADDLDASTGTGATLATVDRIRIKVKLDTSQSTNDMRMDYWRYYEPGTLGVTDSQNALIVETGNYFIKTIHNVSVNESNGLPLSESGDTDGTNLLSRQKFATVNKGSNTSLQIDKYYYLD